MMPSDKIPRLERVGAWLGGEGANNDAVISTRIRLARNLAGQRFPNRASAEERSEVDALVSHVICDSGLLQPLYRCDLLHADVLERQLLVERHLISKELAAGSGARSVCFDHAERTAVMINEEDHLRIQVIRGGMDLHTCWAAAEQLEQQLASLLPFAYDEDFGYLTSCPTNVGTGMRISIMLHLPALVLANQIEKVFEAMTRVQLAVRGLYGEGTQASGDFYQISNQVTLGQDEQALLLRIQQVIPQVIAYEHRAREALLNDDPLKLADRVWRAYGVLTTARRLTSEEMMERLSSIRLGIYLGLIEHLPLQAINELFLLSQPAHLQAILGRQLKSNERSEERARLIRERLITLS